MKRYKLREVAVENASLLDGESRFFLDILRDVGGVTVALRAKTDCELAQIDLDPAETELAKTLTEGANTSAMLAAAETYLSVGNYWAVRRVLDAIPQEEQARSPQIARLRAVSSVQSNDPILAERHYELWRALGDPADLVWANDGLAMLYLRYHPSMLRDRSRAETLLEQAFQTALKHDLDPLSRIFNRNGFALILFRKAKVDEAISLLKWAVDELENIPGKRALMHKSVILYNIAQWRPRACGTRRSSS
ncbi:MAG: hypothetical protein V6Z86_04415 [Hyphomicrobiales bacterium]